MRHDPWRPFWYTLAIFGWCFYQVVSRIENWCSEMKRLWSTIAADRFTVSESADKSVPPRTPEQSGQDSSPINKEAL